jgi:protein-disulfide isomerase
VSQENWRSFAEGGHRIGPANAPVVLVEFSDFQCPACRALEERLRESRKKFPRDLAIVYRHFPLNIHRFARAAAEASECAAQQGRFERMHAVLFDQPDSIGVISWRSFARLAAVPDLSAFERCMRDSTALPAVTRDRRAAEHLGADGTPTVLINGIRFSGALPQATLDSLVESVLQSVSLGERGTKPRR